MSDALPEMVKFHDPRYPDGGISFAVGAAERKIAGVQRRPKSVNFGGALSAQCRLLQYSTMV
jgi:hypothetical protein